MNKTPAVITAYKNLLSSGKLRTNPEQANLVTRLGQLQSTLLTQYTHHHWWQPSPTVSHHNGLYIYGGVGTGKSRLADLFASTLPAQITCRRTHFFEFMTDVHTRLHVARSKSDYSGDPLLKIGQAVQRETSVLCLDEFQVSDIADAMILKRLFTAFWDEGGVLVSTSNRHPRDLYKNGLNRNLFIPFIEELQKRCTVYQMKGEHDYRMDSPTRRDRGDILFTNANDFHASLRAATNNVKPNPVEIPVVMGRKLKLMAAPPAAHSSSSSPPTKQIVTASFAQLCETPLGSSDYHALCAFASTIYLSGLRQFAADELDVVRRFITLIDIAYEARTRVFCLSTHNILETFANIVLPPSDEHQHQQHQSSDAESGPLRDIQQRWRREQQLTVRGEGGSSSSMMSTFIDGVEWSATGLSKASLATGGAGETDVRFAVVRAVSRLHEMGAEGYGDGEDS